MVDGQWAWFWALVLSNLFWVFALAIVLKVLAP